MDQKDLRPTGGKRIRSPGGRGCGPLLNERGEAVGVVAASNPVARIAFAVSALRATTLIDKPAVIPTIPDVSSADRTLEIELVAESIDIRGEQAPEAIEWVMGAAGR